MILSVKLVLIGAHDGRIAHFPVSLNTHQMAFSANCGTRKLMNLFRIWQNSLKVSRGVGSGGFCLTCDFRDCFSSIMPDHTILFIE